tara:strand:- start:923 stop:1240 length:318 start_codon:yes stop_codon:yes gene_type:complete
MRRKKPHKLKKLKNCCYCNRKLNGSNRTLDHIYPRAHGGSIDKRINLIACCKLCNSTRGAMPIQEWKRKVARLKKEYCKENLTVGFQIGPHGSFIHKKEYNLNLN